MPNGGSDCCGTCPFNERNRGEAGYGHRRDAGRDYCTIRELEITGPAFYTYCVNHPHHNPEGIDVPVGPVFEGDSDSRRWPVVDSPDTPTLRAKLIELADRIPVRWEFDYPFGLSLAEAVIMQLGAWGEVDSLPALERIASGTVGPMPEEGNRRGIPRPPTGLIHAARASIARITSAQE